MALFNEKWAVKGVYNFPEGICPKVNVITQLKFELVYNESVVQDTPLFCVDLFRRLYI